MATIGVPIVLALPDLCDDFFSFALQLKKSKDPGDAETLRARVNDLFRSLETAAGQQEITADNLQLTKYALAAFLDEMILLSNWPLKNTWASNPLQLEMFNDLAAGEEFYNKLETLRHGGDPRKIDVLEVYYLCLALGFKGKYGDLKGMQKLKVLMEDLAKEVRQRRGGEGSALSPSWEPSADLQEVVKDFPAWIVGVACAGVLLLLYIILAAILGGVTGDVMEILS